MAERIFAIASALGIAAGSAWYMPRIRKFLKEHVQVDITVKFKVESSAHSSDDTLSNSGDSSTDE